MKTKHGWVVVVRNGSFAVADVRRTRLEAIGAWMSFFEDVGSKRTWEQERAAGARCVKVEIRVLEPEA